MVLAIRRKDAMGMAGMVSESTGRRVFLRVFVVLFALSSFGAVLSMGSGAVASGSDIGEGVSSSLISGVAILRFDFLFMPATSAFIHTPIMLLSTRFIFIYLELELKL
jgi:hypothetical protein